LNRAQALRKRLKSKRILVAPGVFNAISAQLALRTGFEAAYLSGGALANSYGMPDLGMTTLSELTSTVAYIVDKVNLLLIVDADTGFGEAVNVMRSVRELERLDVAAVQIEDQVMPKRCGHLSGKHVVDIDEMIKKVVAAKEASTKGLVVIARTDARSVEGLDVAIERSRVYAKAGADVVFPEALESLAEFEEFSRKVNIPLLANMTEFGRTPYVSVDEFESIGYKIVIFPMTAFRAMLKAVDDAYGELKRFGTQKGMLDRMMPREEIYRLIDYYSYEEQDMKSARSARRILKAR
jgi:methylisocitrate lyase